MQIFNKSQRIYTIEDVNGNEIRLAPSSTCEVTKKVADNLMALYADELILIGNIEEEEKKEEIVEEKPKEVVKPKTKRK